MPHFHILNIETTADGSVTLYRDDINEHYHSVKGAFAESLHIYLELGWKHFSDRQAPIRVFEVGFGTGLNAALTAQAALEAQAKTIYYAVELYPISDELIETLSTSQPPEYLSAYRAVNKAPWDKSVEINPYFTLHKINADVLAINLPRDIDVVYFDAFAPEKQPEIWEESIFRKLYDAMSPSGILTTYCAKGSVRRMLQTIGFRTERMPGPPGGKREVLRAVKESRE